MEPSSPILNENEINEFLAITNTQDKQTAIDFLNETNYDLSKAIQIFFDKGPNYIKNNNNKIKPQSKKDDILAKKYELFLKEKEQNSGFFSSLFKSKQTDAEKIFSYKGNSCDEFKKLFLNKYHYNLLNFSGGRVAENMLKAAKQEKLLCVLLYCENQNIANFISETFEQKNLKEFFAKNFILIGLLDSNADSKQLCSAFPPVKSMPCLTFLFMDILEKVSFLSSLALEVDKDHNFYLEKLKETLSYYHQQKEYQLKIKQKVENEIKERKIQKNLMPSPGLFWNPFYDPVSQNMYSPGDFYDPQPNFNERSQQNRPNRDLIEQQNEEYQKVVELSKKQFEENILKEREKQEESKEKENKVKEIENKEKEKKNQIEERIKYLKSTIGEEDEAGPNVMDVLFRFPSGIKLTRKFKTERKIQDLFDFVELHEFEKEGNDNEIKETLSCFNLLITFPHLNLGEKKAETLKEVFPESLQETIQIQHIIS